MVKEEIGEKKKVQGEKKDKKVSIKREYFFGLGRRKSVIASVKIVPSETNFKISEGVKINNRPLADYFPLADLQKIVIDPFKAVSFEGNFKVNVVVKGGGFRGQAEAVRLAVSRALVKYNEANKKTLKDLGYLTRDARKVERKKAGLKKARRAPQWQKR